MLPAQGLVDDADELGLRVQPDQRLGLVVNGTDKQERDATYLKDAGNEITVTSDVTFTARWTALRYRVVYVYDGIVPENADALPTYSNDYLYGHAVTVAEKPDIPDDYTFTGWLLGETETTGFTIGADTPVTGTESPYIITLKGR